jgi:hypothetical protein
MTPFELAKQKRLELEQEEKAKQENKKSTLYVKDYEDIAWMGISKDPKVFRIVGNPAEAREQNSDSKIVYWGKILHDNGKSFQVLCAEIEVRYQNDDLENFYDAFVDFFKAEGDEIAE